MKTILVIDDDPLFLRMYEASLAFYKDIKVFTAASGKEGIALAQNTHPAVIFLDYKMPGMSGAEVSRALRENPATKSIPVVLVTSETSESAAKDAVFDLFVSKPVTGVKVRLLLQKYLGIAA